MGKKDRFEKPFVCVDPNSHRPAVALHTNGDNEPLHVKLQQVLAQPINVAIRDLSVSEDRIGRLLARRTYNPYARSAITRACEGRAFLGFSRLRTYH